MTNNSLIPYQEVEQFGKAMVASGFFSDVKQISQAVVKIQAGAELGLPPFASMTGIHIIKGKPVLGANVLATLIKNDPRYDYRVKKMDDTEVVIHFYEGGEMVGESSFTIQDANKAGTQNTNKFPRNMLFARAISNGAKWYTPGIFGGMPVYTPEDFGLAVDEDGGMIEGRVVMHETEKEAVVLEIENTGKYTTTFLQYCIDNIGRYDNVFAVKNALKKQWPDETGDRYAMNERFQWLKAHAAERDAEEAGQEPLFDDEPTGNNYDD